MDQALTGAPQGSKWVRFIYLPKGPYTAHLRTLGPKTIPGIVIVFGPRVLKWAVYGLFGPQDGHHLCTWMCRVTEV